MADPEANELCIDVEERDVARGPRVRLVGHEQHQRGVAGPRGRCAWDRGSWLAGVEPPGTRGGPRVPGGGTRGGQVTVNSATIPWVKCGGPSGGGPSGLVIPMGMKQAAT